MDSGQRFRTHNVNCYVAIFWLRHNFENDVTKPPKTPKTHIDNDRTHLAFARRTTTQRAPSAQRPTPPSQNLRLEPDVSACAAALDLTLALGPFDTFPEIMCERGASEGERLYSTHLENEFDAPIGMEKNRTVESSTEHFHSDGRALNHRKK